MKKIGILYGRERSFPAAFVDRINGKAVGEIRAETVLLGGTKAEDPSEYAVIIDRSPLDIPYYRAYLKWAVLQGSIVINNPFWASADDRFFGFSLAHHLGLTVPRSAVIPSKDYPQRITSESLRNLKYPIDWWQLADYVGFPAILRPISATITPDDFSIVSNMDELWHCYDQTGQQCMMLQKKIDYEHFIRCFCIGKDNIIPVKYDPHNRHYHVDHQHLSAETGARVIHDARTINEALGYEINTVDFAIVDGTPYVVDFTNPVPEFDPESITPFYFEQIVELMADMAIDYALHGKPRSRELRWGRFLSGEMARD